MQPFPSRGVEVGDPPHQKGETPPVVQLVPTCCSPALTASNLVSHPTPSLAILSVHSVSD